MNWYKKAQNNILYRGAPSIDRVPQPRNSGGTFFTSTPSTAQNYGNVVSAYQTQQPLKTLIAETSSGATLAQRFFKEYGWDKDAVRITGQKEEFYNNPTQEFNSPLEKMSIFLFPTKEWIDFVSKQGYNSTLVDDVNLCLFNPDIVKFIGVYDSQTGKIKKQAQVNIQQQYANLAQQAAAIEITGTGQNESITIPGTSTSITARDLLEQAKMQLASVLIENGVRQIDTSPIQDAGAQGLAISHEPGVIHIDVPKIFNLAQQALPATSQFDGVEMDPDIVNGLVANVTEWLYREVVGTAAHESQHVSDFSQSIQQGQFQSEEGPAEQYQRQMQDRYAPVQPFKRTLPYGIAASSNKKIK